ncbi:hypothetical protein NQ028_03975 [Corynebacterium phoceense]|nr:hypothetical protein [Corynebacterium phoceense]MCQ9340306.1 hypothetical protein [Corynebacterium phoceense]MCQ9344414.1 hypothetical protein [Corynebacterium phoceense]
MLGDNRLEPPRGGRKRVLHARRDLGVDLADHEPIVRELAQLPGVCTVRDLARGVPQLAVAQ